MKKVKLKPTAERIDSYAPRKEIIYRCSKCNTSFAILGQQIKYCYGCGTEVDWNVKTKLDDEFGWMWVQFVNKTKSNLSCDDYEELYIKELNNKQKNKESNKEDEHISLPIYGKQFRRNLLVRNYLLVSFDRDEILELTNLTEDLKTFFLHSAKIYSQRELANKLGIKVNKVHRWCSPSNPQRITDEDWKNICYVISNGSRFVYDTLMSFDKEYMGKKGLLE